MDNRAYQYRSVLGFDSGGYEGEEYGPQGATTSWITTTALSGTRTSVYYFRDSNNDPGTNANSSKVEITIRDTWTATIAPDNTLNIVADTDILSIVRGSIIGNPNAGGPATRTLRISRYKGGPILAQWDNLNIAATGVISSGVDLPSYSFSLAPGEDAHQSTVYCFNFTPGHGDDQLPSPYVDAMYMGVEFRNILPKDYRPGASWNGGWLSHNRSSGAANIWNGSRYVEMRTENGGVGTGNPPLIYNASRYVNQRNIGSGG